MEHRSHKGNNKKSLSEIIKEKTLIKKDCDYDKMFEESLIVNY